MQDKVRQIFWIFIWIFIYEYLVKSFFFIINIHKDRHLHIVPVARLEAFRALKLSRLDSFMALKSIGQIGGV